MANVPENPYRYDTDTAMMQMCGLMKVDPRVEPKLLLPHQIQGGGIEGKDKKINIKFTNCKIREHLSSMKSSLRGVNFIKEKSDENHRNSEKDYLYG